MAAAKKAAAKKPTQKKAFVANGRKMLVGTKKKGKKRGPKRNGQQLTKRKAAPRKNPASTFFNQVLMSAGLAIGLRLFDGAVQRFVPVQSTIILVVGKGAAAWAVGQYGRGVLKSWTPWVQGVLLLSGALNLYDTWAAPVANQYLGIGAPQVAQTAALTDKTSGAEIGKRYYMTDGNTIDALYTNAESAYMN